MPLKPNLIERFFINRGDVPWLLLDAGLPTFSFWAVIAASELCLFQELKDGPQTVDGLAEELGASRRGLEVLLEALEGLDYLDRENGTVALTDTARKSLPLDLMNAMAPFFKDQMLASADAARAIKEAPEEGIIGWERVKSGPVGRGYQAAMRWLASGTVDEVVGKIELPEGAQRMLDVGGSHGLYTVAFCRKYPDLHGTILDWPIGLEAAERTLEENPDVADQIDLVARDFEREELPKGYDFALLGNIVHGLSPEGNRELFNRLADSTTDIGAVGIVDQLSGVSGSDFTQAVAGLIGFNLFLFSGGRSYPYEQLEEWLRQAGFLEVSQEGLRQSPGFSLVFATKTTA